MSGQTNLEIPIPQWPNSGVLTLSAGSRLLLENANEGIAIVQDGVIKLANPSLLRIIICSEQEITSRPFLNFIYPDDRGMVAERHLRRIEGKEVSSAHSFRVVDRHGNCRWIDAKDVPVVWEGEPSILCFLTDVTESRLMEESLRTSEEVFQSLVDATSDLAWETDGSGVCTYSSPQVRGMLGYKPEEVMGKSLAELLPEHEASRFASLCTSALVRPEPKSSFNFTFIHKHGRRVMVETSAVPILGPDGVVVGFRGIARDITEREEMKRQLKEGVRKLEQTVDRTIQAISLIAETRDSYTAGHQKRTSQLSSAMAERMGIPHERVQVVRVAALLHDIGKIAVPTEVLSKPGHLSEIELALIKTHCQVGYDILKTVDFPWPIADIVHQHHERLDGSGYPLGLKDEEIILDAKILGVADVVEAMTCHRPYRPARGIEEALREISSNSGILYDADAVYACLDLFNKGGFAFEEVVLLSEWYNV